MLGKSMSRYNTYLNCFTCLSLLLYLLPHTRCSMDEADLATVCLQVAKPIKKVVRKTFEEAAFLVRNYTTICIVCMLLISY
jgi:hypothetical protein